MAASKRTTNFKFPLYEPHDTLNVLGDFNSFVGSVDFQLKKLQTAGEATDEALKLAQQTVDTANALLQTLQENYRTQQEALDAVQADVALAKGSAQEANSTAQEAQSKAQEAKELADQLQTLTQQLQATVNSYDGRFGTVEEQLLQYTQDVDALMSKVTAVEAKFPETQAAVEDAKRIAQGASDKAQETATKLNQLEATAGNAVWFDTVTAGDGHAVNFSEDVEAQVVFNPLVKFLIGHVRFKLTRTLSWEFDKTTEPDTPEGKQCVRICHKDLAENPFAGKKWVQSIPDVAGASIYVRGAENAMQVYLMADAIEEVFTQGTVIDFDICMGAI